METHAVGEMAGRIWRHLAQAGKVSLSDLEKAVQADSIAVHMALGWLSREDKLILERKGKSVVVRLKETPAMGTSS
jgi:hypothetical protein